MRACVCFYVGVVLFKNCIYLIRSVLVRLKVRVKRESESGRESERKRGM